MGNTSDASGPAAHQMPSNTAAAATTDATDVGYPHGHLGHLTAAEEEALANFKVFLQNKDEWTPGPLPSHDDQTLLRFLRARRWVIEDAYNQFKETLDWRAANELEVLYETIDVDAYDRSRKLYPQWTGRRDRRGIPVYLFEIRHLDSKTVSEYEKSVKQSFSRAADDGQNPPQVRRLAGLYENLTRFVQPLCTQLPDHPHAGRTPITLSTNIVDVGGVSLRQFWNLKNHMQAASGVATAHYPETLDRIFIIGAPIFFSTVWGWIKRWFDPVTVSKILILGSHEVKPTLEAYIDPKNIPKAYGGELEFATGDMPKLDPVLEETATWEGGKKEIPRGPLYWQPTPDGKSQELLAVGYENGQPRKQRVATLPTIFPPVKEEGKENGNGKTVEPEVATNGQADGEKKPEVTTGVEQAAAPLVSTGAPAEVDDNVQGVQNLSIQDDKTNGTAEVNEKIPETTKTEAPAAATA